MSFELEANHEGVDDFRANIFTYGVLLGACEELCGETFSAIEIQPPQDKPDYPSHYLTWFVNDRLRVKSADASALGASLQQAIDGGYAGDSVRRQYLLRSDTPPAPESEDHIRRLTERLSEFAKYLRECGGFAIW